MRGTMPSVDFARQGSATILAAHVGDPATKLCLGNAPPSFAPSQPPRAGGGPQIHRPHPPPQRPGRPATDASPDSTTRSLLLGFCFQLSWLRPYVESLQNVEYHRV